MNQLCTWVFFICLGFIRVGGCRICRHDINIPHGFLAFSDLENPYATRPEIIDHDEDVVVDLGSVSQRSYSNAFYPSLSDPSTRVFTHQIPSCIVSRNRQHTTLSPSTLAYLKSFNTILIERLAPNRTRNNGFEMHQRLGVEEFG